MMNSYKTLQERYNGSKKQITVWVDKDIILTLKTKAKTDGLLFSKYLENILKQEAERIEVK